MTGRDRALYLLLAVAILASIGLVIGAPIWSGGAIE